MAKGLFKHTQRTVDGDSDGDAKALTHIGMTLTEQHLPTFMECETAKAAWDAFASLFKSESQARRLQLKQELSDLRRHLGWRTACQVLCPSKASEGSAAVCGDHHSRG